MLIKKLVNSTAEKDCSANFLADFISPLLTDYTTNAVEPILKAYTTATEKKKIDSLIPQHPTATSATAPRLPTIIISTICMHIFKNVRKTTSQTTVRREF